MARSDLRDTGLPLAVGVLCAGLLLARACTAAPNPPRPAASAAKETRMFDDDETFMPSADRNGPAPLDPVLRDGVRYERYFGGKGDPQTGGMIAAYDAASGQRLWTLVVFDNVRNPDWEGDAQDCFVAEMHFDADGRLQVTDEIKRHWIVDVNARTSRPAAP